MRNPLIASKKSLLKFILLWIVIIIVHSIILYIHYKLPINQALTDSIVFNGLFAVLGINLWYLVKYSETEGRKNFFKIGLNFFIAGFIIISIWYASSAFITKKIIGSPEYSTFLLQSKIWRLTGGTLYFIIFALVYYVILYKQNWEEKIKNEKRLQESIRKIELDALKMQMSLLEEYKKAAKELVGFGNAHFKSYRRRSDCTWCSSAIISLASSHTSLSEVLEYKY